ncbi:oxidoreductase [Citrobacter amalonaticus]|uniref:oxidoreductase n=1 Tax=Citrobacter amalonaticus TaxID=35703 RepID=UPI00200A0316|nr:oxidoreductase [Citrobacter amalonaticus]MCK8152300.1 oxidoreductase [Citrobacter amalonaticus]
MTNILAGKKIVIAGAGGLLGTQLVKKVVEEGGYVIAGDSNLKLTHEKFDALGIADHYELHHLDITSLDSVRKLLTVHPLLDGAVNVTYPRNKTYGAHFFDVTLESFNENLSLHLGSTFLFSQQCAAYFKEKQHDFSLVNISSIYGVVPPKFEIYNNTQMTMAVEYAAIKSALLHLNKYIVAYIHDSRFKINAVSPGGIFDNQPTPFLDEYKKQTLGKGMLDVKDVLGSIVFLLSDYSKYVTGQNIIVDDGFSL